jgi:hypothetical protein
LRLRLRLRRGLELWLGLRRGHRLRFSRRLDFGFGLALGDGFRDGFSRRLRRHLGFRLFLDCGDLPEWGKIKLDEVMVGCNLGFVWRKAVVRCGWNEIIATLVILLALAFPWCHQTCKLFELLRTRSLVENSDEQAQEALVFAIVVVEIPQSPRGRIAVCSERLVHRLLDHLIGQLLEVGKSVWRAALLVGGR